MHRCKAVCKHIHMHTHTLSVLNKLQVSLEAQMGLDWIVRQCAWLKYPHGYGSVV